MHDHGQDNQPTLLMLSDCVPDAVGSVPRVRAWQLLRLVSQTHRVHLACVMDQPVQLAQWRAIHALTDRLVIERGAPLRSVASRYIKSWHGPAAQQLAMGEALRASIDVWLCERDYDAMLCTHPAMWRHLRDVRAGVHICDMHTPQSLIHLRMTRIAAGHRRWWHERQSRLFDDMERSVASRCDVVTVGHTDFGHKFVTERCTTAVLPSAVDLSYYASPRMSETAAEAQHDGPTLLVHADHLRGGKAAGDWFVRNVWPRVRHAVPAATLLRSDHAGREGASNTLRRASVVVSPEADPGIARLTMLQAMASARATVVPRPAATDIGARHGEHLLVADSDRQWADLCIDALCDASMRLNVAGGGRAFAEQHGRVEKCGVGLRELMTRAPLGAAVEVASPSTATMSLPLRKAA